MNECESEKNIKFAIRKTYCFILFSAAVKLGEHNLETKIDCEGTHCADPPQVIYPSRIIVPKEYNEKNLKHDLTLIELSEEANFTNFVSPVCLPMNDLLTDDLLNKTVEVVSEIRIKLLIIIT